MYAYASPISVVAGHEQLDQHTSNPLTLVVLSSRRRRSPAPLDPTRGGGGLRTDHHNRYIRHLSRPAPLSSSLPPSPSCHTLHFCSYSSTAYYFLLTASFCLLPQMTSLVVCECRAGSSCSRFASETFAGEAGIAAESYKVSDSQNWEEGGLGDGLNTDTS